MISIKKLLKNKKAIQLSINFIVMLILAVAMFSGGLIFLNKFFSKTTEMKGNLDAQTEKQIEKLLDSGSPVVLPIHTKEVYRGKTAVFGIGVLADKTAEYTMKPDFKTAFDSEKKTICGTGMDDCSLNSWLTLGSGKMTTPGIIGETQSLKKNEKGKFLILVSVPSTAKRGTYIFKVDVDKTVEGAVSTPYDAPLEMIVKVP
ncbi:hypothetical protein HOK51_05755 [Candidatus Woesearchaeota archaeon]|jgi:hypothetical protein|nr:hypothetical protein [Candidatus Woesearchaeota archaeon]MBT6519334.1 hypothetical protein [Candidatus Woesearchaeota archaeon]MBT7366794.1 hypothetical protein [Candidatus Woesearchaeota archaeon]